MKKDLELLANEYVDYCSKIRYQLLKSNLFNEFLNKIYNLNCKVFELYYYKAFKDYNDYKKARKREKLESANINIQKSIEIYENKESDYVDLYDYLRANKLKWDSFSEDIFSQRIPIYKIYFYAGEISAVIDKPTQSLEYYKKYQYYNSKTAIPDSVASKNEIVVYSFRNINEYTLADLIQNEITVLNPSKMNDPFDSFANLWSTPENLERICKEHKHINPLSKSYNYFRIRSFVANKDTYETDDKIIKNILMWSHYANGHNGLCIRYRLSKHFIQYSSESTCEMLQIKPIDYDNPNLCLNYNSINTDLAYHTKSPEWTYENEVRLLSYNISTESDNLGIQLDDESKIEAIYFGYCCTEQNINLIMKILENKGIEFYKIDNKPDNIYDLIAVPINISHSASH